MLFKNKSILLLGVGFYDYEQAIVDALKTRFTNVYYANIYYKTLFSRILSHISYKLVKSISDSHVSKQIKNLPSNIDYIIIIKGESLNKEHIELLKSKYSASKFLLYQWDSFIRLKNKSLLLENFDNIFTFDRLDSIKYGFKFRPLFYRKTYTNDVNRNKYDISFVGEMHSNRYQILHNLKQEFIKNGIKYKIILYTGRYTYFINRFIKNKIRKEDSDLFIFKKLSYKQYLELSLSSKVILDLAHPKQSGLTMRTIEAIGMNKKILTNNKDIANYPFLPNENYCTFDDGNILIDYSFFNRNFVSNDTSYFSLNTFIDELLSSF